MHGNPKKFSILCDVILCLKFDFGGAGIDLVEVRNFRSFKHFAASVIVGSKLPFSVSQHLGLRTS
jgi:hypothetical protein